MGSKHINHVEIQYHPIVQSQVTKKRFFPYFWKSNQTNEITIFLDQIEKLSVLVSF